MRHHIINQGDKCLECVPPNNMFYKYSIYIQRFTIVYQSGGRGASGIKQIKSKSGI